MANDGSNGRVIGLLDMDCFECQIYQRDNTKTLGKPCIVSNSSTRIVSVNYEARKFGISRSDSVDEAISKCRAQGSFLKVLRIPKVNGKPDAYKLRAASAEVLEVLESQCLLYDNMILEYSPSDEFYVDMTQEVSNVFALRNFLHLDYLCKILRCLEKIATAILTFVILMCVKLEPQSSRTPLLILWSAVVMIFVLKDFRKMPLAIRVLYGELLMQRMCNEVYKKTKMTASAGVSTNKFRAKLVSSEKKPAGVSSILPADFDNLLLRKEFKDVPGLKSELGEEINRQFGIKTMKELKKVSEEELRRTFNDEPVDKIMKLCIGFDDSPVIPKVKTDSVSSRKIYPLDNSNHKKSSILRKTWWRTLWTFLIFLASAFIRVLHRIFYSADNIRRQNIEYDLKNLSKDIISRLKEERERHSRQTNAINLEIKFVSDTNSIQPQEKTERTVRKRLDFNWELKHQDIYKIAQNFLKSSVEPTVRVTEIGFTTKQWTECEKAQKKGFFAYLGFK